MTLQLTEKIQLPTDKQFHLIIQGVVVKIHNDRWGKKQSFNNRCYSDDQIKRMDSLYIGIRNLNDTRWVNQPKPLEGVKA